MMTISPLTTYSWTQIGVPFSLTGMGSNPYALAGQYYIETRVMGVTSVSEYFRAFNFGTPWTPDWRLFVRDDIDLEAAGFPGDSVMLTFVQKNNPGGTAADGTVASRTITDAAIDAAFIMLNTDGAENLAPFDIGFTRTEGQEYQTTYLGKIRFYGDQSVPGTDETLMYSGARLTGGTKIGDLQADDDVEGTAILFTLIGGRAIDIAATTQAESETVLKDAVLFSDGSLTAVNNNPFIVLDGALYVKTGLSETQYGILADNERFELIVQAHDGQKSQQAVLSVTKEDLEFRADNITDDFLGIVSGIRWNGDQYEGLNNDYSGDVAANYIPRTIGITYSFLTADNHQATVPNAIRAEQNAGEFFTFSELQQGAIEIVLDKIATVANIEFTKVEADGELRFAAYRTMADAPTLGSTTDVFSGKKSGNDPNYDYITIVTSPEDFLPEKTQAIIDLETIIAEQQAIIDSGTATLQMITAAEALIESKEAELAPLTTAREPEGFTIGSKGFATFLHEIGHGLGIPHAHDEGLFGKKRASARTDTPLYTMLSYEPLPIGDETDPETDGRTAYVSTPQLHDIQVLQLLYGANTTHENSDTTYDDWAYRNGNPVYKTIWDTGGTDIIDASAFARAHLIDLRAGHFSAINRAVGVAYDADVLKKNVAIAYDVVIENATGSILDDHITGNQAANTLIGGGGDDTLIGGDGDDMLYGDTTAIDSASGGVDILYGGRGADSLYGGGEDDIFIILGDTSTGPTYDALRGLDGILSLDEINNATYLNDDASTYDGGAGDDFVRIFGVRTLRTSTFTNIETISASESLSIFSEFLTAHPTSLPAIYSDGSATLSFFNSSFETALDAYFNGTAIIPPVPAGEDEYDVYIESEVTEFVVNLSSLTIAGFNTIFLGNYVALQIDSANDIRNANLSYILTGEFSEGTRLILPSEASDPHILTGLLISSDLVPTSGGDDNPIPSIYRGARVQTAGEPITTGGMGSDTIEGTIGDDNINGGSGDDTLNGLAGNDVLYGGHGIDSLDGGAGSDIFIFIGERDGLPDYDADDIRNFAERGFDLSGVLTTTIVNSIARSFFDENDKARGGPDTDEDYVDSEGNLITQEGLVNIDELTLRRHIDTLIIAGIFDLSDNNITNIEQIVFDENLTLPTSLLASHGGDVDIIRGDGVATLNIENPTPDISLTIAFSDLNLRGVNELRLADNITLQIINEAQIIDADIAYIGRIDTDDSVKIAFTTPNDNNALESALANVFVETEVSVVDSENAAIPDSAGAIAATAAGTNYTRVRLDADEAGSTVTTRINRADAEAGAFVYGGDGQDTIIASAHGDIIDPQRGIDKVTLSETSAVDSFVYTIDARSNSAWVPFDGADTIKNFERGIDKLTLKFLTLPDSSASIADSVNHNIQLRVVFDNNFEAVIGVEFAFRVSGVGAGGIATGNRFTILFKDAIPFDTESADDFISLIEISPLDNNFYSAVRSVRSIIKSDDTTVLDSIFADGTFFTQEIPTPLNHAPTGDVKIMRGADTLGVGAIIRVGDRLVANASNIEDGNNMGVTTPIEFGFRWIKFSMSERTIIDLESDLDDASGASYTLQPSDSGDLIRAAVFYTDAAGNFEQKSSGAFGFIAPAPPPSNADAYDGANDIAPADDITSDGLDLNPHILL